jgi:hypothetical protein
MKKISKFIDLSSKKPHITIVCPLCGDFNVIKLKCGDYETTCECKLKYAIKSNENGIADVSFIIPKSKLK